MPLDLTPGAPKASVELGDGGAHAPQIRFEADDTSCIWNGFNVAIFCCPFVAGSYADPAPTSQISPWTTAIGIGAQTPPESVWPLLRAYDYVTAILDGATLEGRMIFTVSGSGSFGIANPYSGLGYTYTDHNPVAFETVDTGWVDLGGPDCLQAAGATDGVVTFGLAWSNFSPFVADVISGGSFAGRWVGGGFPIADYLPNQQLRIIYRPPGYVASGVYPDTLDGGLYIGLETNSCGQLTKTYSQIAAAVVALDLGITATTLGGHGSDTAAPDPLASLIGPLKLCNALATLPDTPARQMAGAECTGGLNEKGAVIL